MTIKFSGTFVIPPANEVAGVYSDPYVRPFVRSFVRSFVLPSVRPCLLYTSDAADDMQCVDLGGRRIIKKGAVSVEL